MKLIAKIIGTVLEALQYFLVESLQGFVQQHTADLAVAPSKSEPEVPAIEPTPPTKPTSCSFATRDGKFNVSGIRMILAYADPLDPADELSRIDRICARIEATSERYTDAEFGALEAELNAAEERLHNPSKPKVSVPVVTEPPLSKDELAIKIAAIKTRHKEPEPKASQPKLDKPRQKRDDGQPNFGECLRFAKGLLREDPAHDQILKAFADAGRSTQEVEQLARELQAETGRMRKHAERMAKDAALRSDLTAGAMKRAPDPKSKKDKGDGKPQKNKKAQRAQQQAQAS